MNESKCNASSLLFNAIHPVLPQSPAPVSVHITLLLGVEEAIQ